MLKPKRARTETSLGICVNFFFALSVLRGNNGNHLFRVQTQDKTLSNLPDQASVICNYHNDWTNYLGLMC